MSLSEKGSYLLLGCLLFPWQACAQAGSIPELFTKMGSRPQVVTCRNDHDVNNRGGHLQGVQCLLNEGREYAVLSGSSSTHAYYSVARLDRENEVLSVNVLMHKPFKHAGGIQVFEDLLVAGIEDNDKKDKSSICIYQIADPENPPVKPVARIERRGEPFRATAGCTAITRTGSWLLLVVGDWDTRHLDFYLGEAGLPETGKDWFEKVYSLDSEETNRSGWVDGAWYAYQNLNLLTDADGKLYLIGFGRTGRNENVADLFQLEHRDLKEFRLKKLVSKSFLCEEGAGFQSGAGIFRDPGGSLRVISCSPHITDTVVLNIFD